MFFRVQFSETEVYAMNLIAIDKNSDRLLLSEWTKVTLQNFRDWNTEMKIFDVGTLRRTAILNTYNHDCVIEPENGFVHHRVVRVFKRKSEWRKL